MVLPKREILALLAGGMWPFAFAPFGFWPLALASLAAIFLLLGEQPRRSMVRGFLFALGMFGAGAWWVFVSIHQFGGLHWSVAGALTVTMILVLSLYGALFGWLVCRFFPGTGAWRWLVALPALWVLLEWVRGWFLSGFGWLSTGYAFIDAPLGGLSPVGGLHLVSWAAALTVGIVIYLLRERPRWPQAFGALALGLVLWGGASVAERHEFHRSAGEPLLVALIQGNVGQDLKWEPAHLLPTIRLYDGLTADHWDADIVVWPEAALPALRMQLTDYLETLDEIAVARDTGIIMGMLVWNRVEDTYFNGVMALGQGEGEYFKRHLVPFGEFFPVPALVRSWLRMMNLPYSDFTRGARDQLPLEVAGHRVAASICYEAAYGATMIRDAAAANLLVNVSNDAWFGDTIAPHQHLQIVRQRAREAGRWMLRATNTGITAVIGPDGRVTARLPQFEVGVLRAEVRPLTGTTPYARFRDFPVVILMVIVLGLALRFRYS